jgi:DNA helicase-2/ATP-dependent DNA helicase PcrA
MMTQCPPDQNQTILAKLNQEQAQAVTLRWGPSLIVAGAGSGKTTVLTRRIAYLISHLNQDAESILAVTFTNKAAGEMKARVENLVGFETGRRLNIGTFHSVCARLLRKEIDQYVTAEGWRWSSNFVIYDETDSVNLVKAAVAKLNLDDKVFVPKNIRHDISALKNDGYTYTQYVNIARKYREDQIAKIFRAYQENLARNNALDFDDLILIFTELITNNRQVLERQRQRFRHVLVDEFQDTNKSQYDLIRMLAPPAHELQSTELQFTDVDLLLAQSRLPHHSWFSKRLQRCAIDQARRELPLDRHDFGNRQ